MARSIGIAWPLISAVLVACSSGSNSTNQTSATCGNGVVESGEQCDVPVVPTCAQATQGTLPAGVVTCIACQVSLASCQPAPNGTAGVGAASGSPGGGFVGSGGSPGGGGATASGGYATAGGFPSAGGLSASGGFPASGGLQTSGGFTATGGLPGTGGDQTTGGAASGGGGSSTGGTPSSGPLGDVNALRQACVDTINQYRATLSLPPLTRATASVETCSDSGAQSDATTGTAHGSAGKCPGMGAQDTCPGWNPQPYGGVENALKACLKSMWAEGDPPEGRTQCIQEYFSGNTACFLAHGHYLNMSSTDNTVVSCGFYVMPDGKVWMNQDFGT